MIENIHNMAKTQKAQLVNKSDSYGATIQNMNQHGHLK